MKLYDKYLMEIQDMLVEYHGRILQVTRHPDWNDIGNHNMILKSDMAYELGGGNLPAISGIGFTGTDIINNDEIILYGPDLNEIKNDSPYARIVYIKMDESHSEDDQKMHELFRKVDYEKYHINPEGFMMRISVAGNREPVRIGRNALQAGLNFSTVGSMFINAYKSHREVVAVRIIYITEPEFPYENLKDKVLKLEKITESMNYIFNNIKMDCSICGMKEVCDEVEGLRELHFGR